jgi:hypothetical protein
MRPSFTDPVWNWFWEGAAAVLPLWEKGGDPRDVISGREMTRIGSPVWAGASIVGSAGAGWRLTSTPNLDAIIGTNTATVIVLLKPDLTASDAWGGVGGMEVGAGGSRFHMVRSSSTTTLQSNIDFETAPGGFLSVSGGLPDGEWTLAVLRYDGTTSELRSYDAISKVLRGADTEAETDVLASFSHFHLTERGGGESLAAQHSAAYVLHSAPPWSKIEELLADPFGPLRLARQFFGVLVVPAGIATEQNIAFAITALESLAVGLSTEQDLGLAVTVGEGVDVGLTTEQDVSQPVDAAEGVDVGLTTEQDVSLPVGAEEGVDVGLAAEQDLSQPIDVAEGVDVGLSTEQDIGFPVTAAGSIPVGLSTEQDIAQPVGVGESITIGLASEDDLALTITANRLYTTALATEQDLALLVDYARSAQVGLTTEQDIAQTITALESVLVGQSTETDVSLGVTLLVGGEVGLATEQDISQPVTVGEGVGVGLGTETDTAFPVTAAELVSVGVGTETDLALGVGLSKALELGLATEQDLAQAVAHARALTLGLATEIDVAFSMILIVTVLDPNIAHALARVYSVTAGTRQWSAHAVRREDDTDLER